MSDPAESGSVYVMAYTLDTSRAPLVVVRATAAVDDEAAIAAWYAGVDAFLARNQRFVSLMDMRGAPSDATRRKRFMAFISARKEHVRRLCIAHAGVVGSTLERGFFTAYLWLVGDEVYVPVKLFDAELEAEAWLLAQYRQATT